MNVEQLMNYGMIFTKIDKNKVSMDTVKGTSKDIDSINYLVYNEVQNKRIINLLHDVK